MLRVFIVLGVEGRSSPLSWITRDFHLATVNYEGISMTLQPAQHSRIVRVLHYLLILILENLQQRGLTTRIMRDQMLLSMTQSVFCSRISQGLRDSNLSGPILQLNMVHWLSRRYCLARYFKNSRCHWKSLSSWLLSKAVMNFIYLMNQKKRGSLTLHGQMLG